MMTDTVLSESLFPQPSKSGHRQGTGVLPFQQINTMIREQEIWSTDEIRPDQVQPASLDLRLGKVAHRVRASFLPGPGATVMEKIEQLDAYPIDLTVGAVLEKGCVYVIPLLESVKFKSGVTGFANPKSSTGRLDILTRLITDKSSAFDKIGRGYSGPLYVEVAPRTFSVVVKTGTRLNQARFRRGSSLIAASELERLHKGGQFVLDENTQGLRDGKLVGVTIDLHGNDRGGLIGFRAKKFTDRIDLAKIGHYDPAEFWEPIYCQRRSPLILDPNDFYILVTREAVQIPPEYAAEMVAYDTSVGEFRVHYAGFFDPGFGWGPGAASRAVLEVRSHEVPFMLDDGQTVGWLQYEKMADRPDRLYGAANIQSNYQGQGLALAKQFRAFTPPA